MPLFNSGRVMVLLTTLCRRMFFIRRVNYHGRLIRDDRFLLVREGTATLRRLARLTLKDRCDDVVRRRVRHLRANDRYVAKCFRLKGALRRDRRHVFIRLLRYVQDYVTGRSIKYVRDDIVILFKVGRSDRFLNRTLLGSTRVKDDLILNHRDVGLLLKRYDRCLCMTFNVLITRIRPRLMRLV